MQEVRRAGERGSADHGWLRSCHSFLFADYYDPEHVEFGPLRVINEDRVTPGAGFGTHSHRDMEMISYVLEGELKRLIDALPPEPQNESEKLHARHVWAESIEARTFAFIAPQTLT